MTQSTLDLARDNMILNQVRSWGVLDEHILELLRRIPRERFVGAGFEKLAYADTALPLSGQRVTLPPKLEARLFHALNPQSHDRVLEVGTGSGYLTALLASSTEYVTSIETDEGIAELARERLRAESLDNVRIEIGDASKGWVKHAPYDLILVNGALADLPESFLDQLAVGGRLVCMLGKQLPNVCVKMVKQDGGIVREELFETEVPYLAHGAPDVCFEF
ncbi:MAG: protein-L-isoaspartate O-methyltransferase [Immundisolibacteraceae bacterium]|nr:protein-L-isoaspartate O-methyltransferase [Immundisolibacteraceae bacterium]